MRDDVGGYDVDVTWSLGDSDCKITFHITQTAGAHAIEIDELMTSGAFMVRIPRYFGWSHYNAVMDDAVNIDDDGNVLEKERARNYFDVAGNSDYVKPIESNILFDYKTNFDEADETFSDGRLKYAIPNKFVPYEFDYEVKTSGSQVTFAPVAMSNLIKGTAVNGKPASSRCPERFPPRQQQ